MTLTLWFPSRHGGALTTLNVDYESFIRERDKRLISKSRAFESTSPPSSQNQIRFDIRIQDHQLTLQEVHFYIMDLNFSGNQGVNIDGG